jgi:hypothetical protein
LYAVRHEKGLDRKAGLFEALHYNSAVQPRNPRVGNHRHPAPKAASDHCLAQQAERARTDPDLITAIAQIHPDAIHLDLIDRLDNFLGHILYASIRRLDHRISLVVEAPSRREQLADPLHGISVLQ